MLRAPVTALVETLAAIPSVVIGLWGIFVLGPVLRDHVEPALHDTLGFIPLFGPPSSAGPSVFTAVVVLTIMILPIVSSICRELFLGVPRDLKEGALALGTTRWEMVRGVVFPYARGGIAAALILGLGRALGEAIAVTQVIGGGVFIHWNLFATGDTLASKIAASYQGAQSNIQISALVYLALILLVFSLMMNVAAQWIVRRVARRQGLSSEVAVAIPMSTHSLTKASLRAEGLPRRRAMNRLMEVLAWLAAAIAVAILGIVVFSVAKRGAPALNLDLLTKTPARSASHRSSRDSRTPLPAPSCSSVSPR